MTVTLEGANGFFPRVGKIIDADDKTETRIASLTTERDDIDSEYSSADRDMIGLTMANHDQHITDAAAVRADYRSDARKTLIDMFHNDSKLTPGTEDERVKESLERLDAQMRTAAATLNETTVSASSPTAGAANIGDGELLISLTNPDGEDWHNVRGEVIELECTFDSQGNSEIEPGEEVFLVRGIQKVYIYGPLGYFDASGIHENIACTSGAKHEGIEPGQNILNNSDFEDFIDTANLPDNWDDVTGTVGTHIRESSDAFRGSSSLELKTSGGVSPEVKQDFLVATGTAAGIDPNSSYAIGIWLKKGFVQPSQGTLTFTIEDGSGVVFTSTLDVTLAAVTNSWQFFSLIIQVPADAELSLEAHINISSAMGANQSVIVGELVLEKMRQLGVNNIDGSSAKGGPYAALFAGERDFAVGDTFSATITNNDQGALVRGLDRMYGAYDKGIRLATSGSPTIPDSHIS